MTKTTINTSETLVYVPLARLKLATENARGHGIPKASQNEDFQRSFTEADEALTASIIALGRLTDPLHAYQVADAYFVWDGGRRLRILNAMKTKDLPESLAKDGVPVLVSASQADAHALSLATFNRARLHPAEEFLAYRAAKAAGKTVEEIAAAAAAPTRRVHQLLRLVNLAPEVIDLFTGGKIALDVAEAFTLTQDHERQRGLVKHYGDKITKTGAWDVRKALAAAAVRADSRIAKLVGVEAYVAAGGTFLQDLFNHNHDQQDWADGEIAEKLFAAKIKELIDAKLAEGWAWCKVAEGHDWSRGLDQKRGPWSKEFMATAGAFVTFDYSGDMKVQAGYHKPAPVKAGETGASPAALPLSKKEPTLYGYTNGGHHTLTEVATQATKVGLIRKPEVAADAVLTHLAWMAFQTATTYGRTGADGSASRLTQEMRNYGRAPVVHVEGEAELDAVREAWAKLLAPYLTDRVGFCDYVAALEPDQKAELLAYSFGVTLWAREEKIDYRRPNRWAHLGWIAKRTEVDPVKAWTPPADFLKSASKEALADAVKALKVTVTPQAKKSDLVRIVAEKAKEKGWVPKLLADFVNVGEPAKAVRPAKAARAGNAAQPPQAASEAPATPSLDGEGEITPALAKLAGVKVKAEPAQAPA